MKPFLFVVSNYPIKKITVLEPYENRKQINRDSFMIGMWKIKKLKK